MKLGRIDRAALGAMQNDFLHPRGAYGRAGLSVSAIAALPQRLKPVAEAMRGWRLALFDPFYPGARQGRRAFDRRAPQELRPFLTKGDFAPGSFGHDLVEALKPADLMVEKVAYSAFYMSSMDFVLRRAGIETLIFSGIVTNGCVASTLRDAQARDFRTILLQMAAPPSAPQRMRRPSRPWRA